MNNYFLYQLIFSYFGEGGKDRTVYVLATDEIDAKNVLYSKVKEHRVLVKSVERIPVHFISSDFLSTLMSEHYDIFKSIDDIKQSDKELQKKELKRTVEQAENDWYAIDEVINDGNLKAKEDYKTSKNIGKD